MPAAVDVALEGASLFGQFAYASKGKDLKAATIRQYGLVPTVEAVQAAGFLEYLCAGSEVEVVGVAQYDLSLHFLVKVAVGNAFHASYCADGHEDGGFYLSVVGRDEACTGIGEGVCML